MKEIQNARILICFIAMLISGCAIIWQVGNHSLGNRSRPAAAILAPIFLSSGVSVLISMFAVNELTQRLILNVSLAMPVFYMIIELLYVHGGSAVYESDNPRRQMFYRFIYFLGLAAGLIPYCLISDFCELSLPLDVAMGVSVFLQLYCLSLQMRRWVDFVEEPEEK